MKILLLSSSPVIYRLVKLGTESMDEREIVEYRSCQNLPDTPFDIAFIDDKVCLGSSDTLQKSIESIDALSISPLLKIILLFLRSEIFLMLTSVASTAGDVW